jgi:hypothetical protein
VELIIKSVAVHYTVGIIRPVVEKYFSYDSRFGPQHKPGIQEILRRQAHKLCTQINWYWESFVGFVFDRLGFLCSETKDMEPATMSVQSAIFAFDFLIFWSHL